MAEVTEIVHLKLQAGSDLYDSSSPASGLWKQALEAVEKQHGYKGNLWVRSDSESSDHAIIRAMLSAQDPIPRVV